MTITPLPRRDDDGARDPAAQAVRQLPSVQKLLETPQALDLLASHRREPVVDAVRQELSTLREAVLAGRKPGLEAGSAAFFDAVRARLHGARADSLLPVINATGVVLHTNLGRSPLAPEALAQALALARGYSSLEFDLEHGERGSRHAHLEPLLCRLVGAEAALAVNNCAAAVLLSLTALARGGEVIVSRGELVEIGGSFRIPEVIAQSGARLVEVGTTNKTRLADYERAIGPDTRMILRSHPSNYRVVGFTEEARRAELAVLARRHGLAFMEDLGSGTLVDLRRFGLPGEPTVQQCVREGGGLVAFSGDKLLGGPQAGLLVGPAALVEPLRKHPLHRALRIDKLSLAALQATLRLYDQPAPPELQVPVLRMLAQPLRVIEQRARRLQRRLRRDVPALSCRLARGESLAGGGSLPEARLPTALLQLELPGLSAQALAGRLRAGRPVAVVGRMVERRFALDLRTVADDEVVPLARALAQVLRPSEPEPGA